jgi:hypothetical protein
MVSQRRLVLACVLTSITGCFDPEAAGPPASTDDATGPASTGIDLEPSSEGESGEGTCSVDGDCVDVDTCSIDTCEAGTCVHTPNTNDPDCVCMVAADCVMLPDDNACRARTCEDGVCGIDFVDTDTPLDETQQVAEDCALVVCDGAGEVVTVDDASDVPVDGLECTTDACNAGVPENVPARSGTKCAAGECDADGDCIGCNEPADCGGESTFCEMVTCESEVCGVAVTDAGTPLPEQNDGDCQTMQCDGKGNAAAVTDDGDLPEDDGNDCTDEVCEGGVPSSVAVATNTACDDDGGSFCDREGTCVECTQNSQCGGGGGCMIAACVDNACTLVPNVGATCNDGLFCTATDTCNAAGACVGAGNPCDGEDGDGDCSEQCNEAADDCSINDDNGSDCGACRTCQSGTCNFNCSPLAMCCDDVCISMGQSCP